LGVPLISDGAWHPGKSNCSIRSGHGLYVEKIFGFVKVNVAESPSAAMCQLPDFFASGCCIWQKREER
jgi:hypothetical protein